MRALAFLLSLLAALALALGAPAAPRAPAHGLTLVICGADGPRSITLEDKEKRRCDCCDCCLAASFAALAALAPEGLRRADGFVEILAPGAGQGVVARGRVEHPVRGPPVSA